VGMAIMLAYAAMRYVVYAMFPIESFETIPGVAAIYHPGRYEWWVRDTIMDGPRLVSLAASLWVGRYFWSLERLGLHARRPVLGVIGGSGMAALVLLNAVFGAKPFEYTSVQLVILSASSVIVAAHEELLYRGVLFKALYDWVGTRAALIGSAALFAVFHVQAQPVGYWPSLFLIGLLAAALRAQGVGLVWLMAGHAVADSVFYLGTQGPARLAWWPWAALLVQLGVALGAYTWAIRTRHRSPLAVD